MPREAKPYVERGWYVSRPFGVYLRLCPADDGMTEAKRLLKLELGRLEAEREQGGGRVLGKVSVTEMFVAYLEHIKATKDDDTFRDYQWGCTEFAKDYGTKPARSLTRADAGNFKLAMMKKTYVKGKKPPQHYRPKTINHALIAVRAAFNWAIDTERLPAGKNPFARVELLPTEGRQRVATEEEYQALLANCTDDAFRDVLVAMRHTSSRPQDIYTLTWPMVDWENKMWVLKKHKTSRTARNPKPRIIGMSDAVEQVLRRRLQQSGPEGHVFLNAAGTAWTKDTLGSRMRRLRVRAGVKPDEQGEEFVLYTNRHTFLTTAGADPRLSLFTLMNVAGHSNPATTERYVHEVKMAVARAGRQVGDRISESDPASAD